MKTLEIIIDNPQLLEHIEKLAKRYGVSEEEMIRRLLKEGLKQKSNTPGTDM